MTENTFSLTDLTVTLNSDGSNGALHTEVQTALDYFMSLPMFTSDILPGISRLNPGGITIELVNVSNFQGGSIAQYFDGTLSIDVVKLTNTYYGTLIPDGYYDMGWENVPFDGPDSVFRKIIDAGLADPLPPGQDPYDPQWYFTDSDDGPTVHAQVLVPNSYFGMSVIPEIVMTLRPSWIPFSLERILAHELGHAAGIGSTLGENIDGKGEALVITTTNSLLPNEIPRDDSVRGHSNWTISPYDSDPPWTSSTFDQMFGVDVFGITVDSQQQYAIDYLAGGSSSYTINPWILIDGKMVTTRTYRGVDYTIAYSDQNNDGTFDTLSTSFDYDNASILMNSDVAVTKDANGNILDAEVLNRQTDVYFKGTQISVGAIGSIFGTTLGRSLADTDLERVLYGSVLGAIGQNLAQTVGFWGLTRLDFEKSVDVAFGDFGLDFGDQLRGAIGSYLTAELISFIDIDGFAGELVDVVAGHVVGTIVNNILEGATTSEGIFDGLSDVTSYANVIGSFLGSKLANEVVNAKTTEGQIGGSLGGALGGYLATQAIASTVGLLANLVVPFIGSFIGTVVGTVLGDLFGDEDFPRASAEVDFDAGSNAFVIGAVKEWDEGDADLAKSLATIASESLNNIYMATGALLVNGGDIVAGSYGHHMGDLAFSKTNTFNQSGNSSDRYIFDTSEEVLNFGVISTLDQMQLAGGSVFAKRAFYNSLDKVTDSNGLPDGSLSTVAGDIGIGQRWEVYFQNMDLINSLIMMRPESVTAADWILTFQAGFDLDLDKRHEADWNGGWQFYLDQNSTNAAGLDLNTSNSKRGWQLTTTEGITYSVIDTILPGSKDLINGTSGNDTIAVTGDHLTPQLGYTANGESVNSVYLDMSAGTTNVVVDQFDAAPTDAFTIVFDVDVDAALTTGGHYPIEYNDGVNKIRIAVRTDRVYVYIGSELASFTGPVGSYAGQRQEFAVTWDSVTGAVSLYVDGVLDATKTIATGLTFAQGGDVHIGQLDGGTTNQPWSWADPYYSVVIYDRVLTAAEVADPTYATGSMVLGFDFQENSGATALEKVSGVSYDILGTALWGEVIDSQSGFDIDVAAEIHGGDGDDVITGGDLGNDLYGDAGNDTITGGKLDDWIFGGDGNDTLAAGPVGSTSNGNYLDGGAGDDILLGRGGSDWLEGGDGADQLYGEGGGDILSGGANGTTADQLYGGAGDDIYLWNLGDGDTVMDDVKVSPTVASNTDYIGFSIGTWLASRTLSPYFSRFQISESFLVGLGTHTQTSYTTSVSEGAVGHGYDTLQFGAGVSIENFYLERATSTSPDLLVRIVDDLGAIVSTITLQDWFNEMHRIEELAFADGQTVKIAHMSSYIVGTSGDDILVGTNGNDFIYGGTGNDHIFGLLGDDFTNGGADDDVVSGGGNNDIVLGASGNDYAFGDAGGDRVLGGEGDDLVHGGSGNDTVAGDQGNDTVIGGSGNDTFKFSRGDGHDVIADGLSSSGDILISTNGTLNDGGTITVIKDANQVVMQIHKFGDPGTVLYQQGKGWNSQVYFDESDQTLHYIDLDAAGSTTDSGTDTLEMGFGIEFEDLMFEQVGDDLRIAIFRAGSDVSSTASVADSVTIADWYTYANGAKPIENLGLFNTGNISLDTTALVAGSDGDDTMTGSTGRDWMTGGAGSDTMDGASGNDWLVGHGGNDDMKGGAGNDMLLGGSGDDVLEGGAGADQLYGGSGFDSVSYAGATSAVEANLFLQSAKAISGSNDATGDTMVSIEGIIGSNYGDTLYGSAGANELAGGVGNDTLYGGVGDDTYVFNLGDGQDTVDETPITNYSFELAFDAQGNAQPGFDVTFDYTYEDEYVQYAFLRVKQGTTTIYSKFWGIGNPNIPTVLPAYSSWPTGGWMNGFELMANGSAAKNTAVIDTNEDAGTDDSILFGNGITVSDIVLTQSGDDLVIDVGAGSDQITVTGHFIATNNSRIEWLEFSNGHVLALAGLSFDGTSTVGDDLMFNGGSVGNTVSTGDGDDDVVLSANGTNTVTTGLGEDEIWAGTGADAIDGGADIDTVYYTESTAGVDIDLKLDIAASAGATGGSAVGDTFTGIENIHGSAFGDTIKGDAGDNVLVGGDGNDDLRGDLGGDVLIGGDGDDIIWGNDGEDVLLGDAGADNLWGNLHNDYLFGGSGNDNVYGGYEDDWVYGEDGDDTVQGGRDNDHLIGGLGNDELWGDWAGRTTEVGNDVFHIERNSGSDIIKDYNTVLDQDRIVFDDETVGYENLWFEQSGNDLIIQVLNGDSVVTVEGYFLQTTPTLLLDVLIPGGAFTGALDVAGLLTEMNAWGSVPTDGEVPIEILSDVAAFYGVTVEAWDPVVGIPTLDPFASQFTEGTIGGATLTATDPEGDPVTYRFTATGNPGGHFVIVGDQLQLVTPLDYESLPADFTPGGSISLEIEAVDSTDKVSAAVTSTVSILNSNEAPTITGTTGYSKTNTVSAGTLMGTAAATDPDGDALTWSITGATSTDGVPESYTVNSAGQVTLLTTHANAATSTETITVKAADTGGGFDTDTIVVTYTYYTSGGGGGGPPGGGELPPVVLDLDGDGIELVSLAASSTFFDVDGDGEVELTGWVGADDGLLALDRNNNGLIDDGSEISFINDYAGAVTDLEGLKGFDSNDDDVLDASDAQFGDFLVWRDANSNGISEAGELMSLAEAGITSIDLIGTSTGANAYDATDNVVLNTSTFTWDDGSMGLVGDVGLSYLDGNGAEKNTGRNDGVTQYGTDADDTISGKPDQYWIYGGKGNDTLSGKNDEDRLYGEAGNDVLDGADGNDLLYGGSGSDTILGGSGEDALFGGVGNDSLDGEAGKDTLVGGAGDDSLLGGGDRDVLLGEAGNDTLDGGKDNDFIRGGTGDDIIIGGAGKDTLYGDAGNDTLTGGVEADTFVVFRNHGTTTITDYDGTGNGDVIKLDGGISFDQLWFEQDGDDLVISVLGNESTIIVSDYFIGSNELALEAETPSGHFAGKVDVATLVAVMSAYGPEPLEYEVPASIHGGVEAAWNLPGNITPVVLDLGGNGLQLTEADQEPHVFFDVDGDGVLERTGWIGADDAFLALDRNGDGVITSGDEISFIGDLAGAQTDLQGLVAFDTNGNGLLDAGDAGFGDFLVWQDANGDGVSDASELSSLAEAGIESIDLAGTRTGETIGSSDGNTVFAHSSFTRTDGSTGEVGDVALRYFEVTDTLADDAPNGTHQSGEIVLEDLLPADTGTLASGRTTAEIDIVPESLGGTIADTLATVLQTQHQLLLGAMLEFDAAASSGGFETGDGYLTGAGPIWRQDDIHVGNLRQTA